METKEERVTRQEGLLHNHKQEIPVETLCHRTFGDRLSQSRSLGLSFRSLALRARSQRSALVRSRFALKSSTCEQVYFGERESFRIYILAPVGLVMQVSMFGRRGWGGGIRV